MPSIDRKKAAQERAKVLSDRSQRAVDALEVERLGYVQRNLPERVAQVDAQIAYYRALG